MKIPKWDIIHRFPPTHRESQVQLSGTEAEAQKDHQIVEAFYNNNAH